MSRCWGRARGWQLGWLGVVLLGSLPGVAVAAAQATLAVRVPMKAGRWAAQAKGTRLDFLQVEGFPEGAMQISEDGEAALSGLRFRDGTIEFDALLNGNGMPGIVFRRADERTGEEFYLRPGPNCRASDDCVQYAPLLHGFMLWNMYPEYQTAAPVLDKGWNHVKLVVRGRRLRVYLNGGTTPTLEVGRLESEAEAGGLLLRGPAIFANLVVNPGAVEGLSPEPRADATARDGRYLRRWEVSGLKPWHDGMPTLEEQPGGAWTGVTAERRGMVNLNRVFAADSAAPREMVWLRTTVLSDREQMKQVEMGWVGQVWVWVNGRYVTTGKNFYYPEGERRSPDGRLSLENGGFALPLQRGSNEVVVALDASIRERSIGGTAAFRTRYGWGLMMRFDDAAGLRLTGR